MGIRGKLVLIVLGLALVALVVIGLPYLLVRTIQQTTDQAMAPVNDANQLLKTQISQLMNPTPTILPDPVTIIREVRTLARLETIQFTVEKLITAQTGRGELGFLFGDKLLFVAHGTVIAGVDLGKLSSEDLKVQDGVLTVRLPAAEVFVATLDNENSYVYDRETGLLTRGDANLETAARKAAEQEILSAALKDGILETAQLNAESYLERLFDKLGYPEVVFLPAATPQP